MAFSLNTSRFPQPHSWSPRRASIVSAYMGGFRLLVAAGESDIVLVKSNGGQRRGQSQMERMGMPG